ncbi:MAG: hypothetical protein JWN40_990 [Phycisphaerales bacterium]|nr:hypothetical protein [Phycisphaerales bacterium]
MPTPLPLPQIPRSVPPTPRHKKPQPHRRAGAKRTQPSRPRCTNLHENARFQQDAVFSPPIFTPTPAQFPELFTPARVQAPLRNLLTAAVLAAAIATVTLPAHAQLAGDKPAQPAAAVKAQADVPVKVVVLFSSGVGYFEHAGSVKGATSTELRFKTNQINDILKSLLLQDMGGGKVTTVVYPSQDPIEKTLRSFQVDITGDPSLAALLGQLRGAKVQVTIGTETLAGTILGLEKKPKAVNDKGSIDVWVINLISGGTIRSVELAEAKKIDLEDPQLQDELGKALAALAQARDQDKKPVTINFTGEGERQVRIGYVVETPIWKTSYRLVLPGEGADAAGNKDKPKLLGWAIVENQTDNDWGNVQLSLVSGRPISFIQDLYRPLYVPRPVVQPELYASLRPQTYDAGMGNDKRAGAKADGEQLEGHDGILRESLKSDLAARGMNRAPAAAAPKTPQSLNGGVSWAADSLALADHDADYKPMDDFSRSVASIASASKVGELFQYTVGSVSLPRQRSAMIPIITDDVEIEKLSIYNPTVFPRNPLNGARIKNTTGKHLLQGPITVIDGATYAGDARIDNVPPTQERLISYGVDLQVLVDGAKSQDTDVVQTGKIIKGVLELTHKFVHTHHYTAESKADKDKTLVVEHPFRTGWKLLSPEKPMEKTDSVYRFKQPLAAGKSASLTVVEELVSSQTLTLLNTDIGSIEFFGKSNRIPKSVREVLTKVVTLRNAMTDTQRQIEERRRQLNDITTEQTRIRENIKTVDHTNDYATRLLKKLNDQEAMIENLQGEIVKFQKQFDQQQKDFESYLQNTSVDDKN